MSAIKAGDMVQLIFACCATGRQHIGWTGIAEEISSYPESTCFCGYVTHGLHAWVDIGGKGVVPVSWLIKIEPPAAAEKQTERDEVTA